MAIMDPDHSFRED
jgi:hypothetical protein